MAGYVIDFSDPLKQGFNIPPGGFNGPGGSNSATTLRLYGRGALEWGEAIDENLVRLAENFASASPPSNAISGQLWVEQSLYYRNSLVNNVLQGWYFYDVNEPAPNKWKLVNNTGVVLSAPTSLPAIGQYYYDASINSLRGWYSLGRYEPATWVIRSSMTGAGIPVSPALLPPQHIRIRNNTSGVWNSPSSTTTAPVPPLAPEVGAFWYNPVNGILSIWTGVTWAGILGPAGAGAPAATGIQDLGFNRIINVGTPTAGSDAVTKSYVDVAVGTPKLPLTGGNLSGPGNLGVAGTLSVSGPAQFTGPTNSFANIQLTGALTALGVQISNNAVQSVSGIFGTITAGSISATNISVTGGANSALNANNTRILNVANAIAGSDAINLSQATALIPSASPVESVSNIRAGATNSFNSTINGSSLGSALNQGLFYPFRVSTGASTLHLGDLGQAASLRVNCSSNSNAAAGYFERSNDGSTSSAHCVYATIGEVVSNGNGGSTASLGSGSAIYARTGALGVRTAVARFEVSTGNTSYGVYSNSGILAAAFTTTSDRRTKRKITSIDLVAAMALSRKVQWYTFDKLVDSASVLAQQIQINTQGEEQLEQLSEISFDLDGDGQLSSVELEAYRAAQQIKIQEHARQVEAATLRSQVKLDVSDTSLAIAKQAGVIAQELQALTVELGEFEWLVTLSNKHDSTSALVVDYNSLYAILEAATQERLRLLESRS